MTRRISVTVKPNSRSVAITQSGDGEFRASVCEPDRDGKANRELVDLLARHFHVPKSSVKIIRGHAARKKIIELS